MIEDFYISCVRKRPSETINSRGRAIKTYVDTSINGYIGSINRYSNVNVTDKNTIDNTFNFFSDDFELQFGDIIYYEFKYYEVVTVPQNTAHQDHHINCKIRMVEEVKQFEHI